MGRLVAVALLCGVVWAVAGVFEPARADLLPHCVSGFGETGDPVQDCPDWAAARAFEQEEAMEEAAFPEACLPNDSEGEVCLARPVPGDVPTSRATYYVGNNRGGCGAFSKGGHYATADGRTYRTNGHILTQVNNSLRYCKGKPRNGPVFFYVNSFKKSGNAAGGAYEGAELSPGGLISHDFTRRIVFSGCGTITRYLTDPTQEFYLRCRYLWVPSD